MPIFFTHNEPVFLVKHEITFHSHFHYEAELIYCIRGAYRVLSHGETYDLHAGDIWLGFPFDEHSYVNIGENTTMIGIFPTESIGAVGDLMLNRRPKRAVVNVSQLSPGFGDGLVRIAQLYTAQMINAGDKGRYYYDRIVDERYLGHTVSRETIVAYLSAAIGELFGVMELCQPTFTGVGSVKRIIEYCHGNLSDPGLSMSSVSKAVGLSRSQISRIMSQTMKTTFTQFIHALRIKRARDLIKNSNDPIIGISLDCGFMSQCSFNRVFREMVGMTPTEYRRLARKNGDNEF